MTVRIVVRFVALIASIALLPLLPVPVGGLLLLLVGLVLPAVLWGRFAATRLDYSALLAASLGMLITVSGWSVLEFFVLLARGGVREATSGAVLVAICAAPLVTNRPLPVRASAVRIRAAAAPARDLLVLLVLIGASATLLALSMKYAAAHTDSPGAFAIFWAGLLVLYVPLFALIRSTSTRMADTGIGAPRQTMLIAALGIGSYLPFYIRSPATPFLNDEIAHWGETVRMVSTGVLFQPDGVLFIGPKYPGLETLAAGLTELSGMREIQIGRAVILVCHLLSAFGVAMLAGSIGATQRGMLLAAAIYAVSPSFVQIDNMFSYESFAVPLTIWTLYAVIRGSDRAEPHRRMWLGLAFFTAFDEIITHHLTSFVLGIMLLVLATSSAIRRRGTAGWAAPLFFALGVLGSAIVWSIVTRAGLASYLGDFVSFAWDGVRNFLGFGKQAVASGGGNGTSRGLFGGSVLPIYERALAFVAQPLLLAWFAYGAWIVRRRITGPQLALIVLGLAYFASLPLSLIGGAAAGAHRSWAISFVGLAVVTGMSSDQPAPIARFRGRVPGAARRLSAIVALVVVLVGSVAVAGTASARLPGPFTISEDGRSYSRDMIRSALWFQRTQGNGRTVLTSFRVLAIFGSYGQAYEKSFPQWGLFFPRTFDPDVVRQFLKSGNDYIVVDSRLATDKLDEPYFTSFEPTPPSNPLPKASLTKFAHVPWLRLIHHDGHISIYKVDRAAFTG